MKQLAFIIALILLVLGIFLLVPLSEKEKEIKVVTFETTMGPIVIELFEEDAPISETPQGWGYAVFGTVIDGFETVEAIASVSTGSSGHHQDVPLEDITVQKTKVTKE